MKLIGIGLVAVATLALGGGQSTADNGRNRKHDSNVERCVAAYEAGARAAHAPGSPTGAVRKRTMHRLAEEKKACIARASR